MKPALVPKVGRAGVDASKRYLEEILMATYRQRKGKDAWHWCNNCVWYPTTNFEERKTKPKNGKLCAQCVSKEKNKNCQK